jgi:hypothetical protein
MNYLELKRFKKYIKNMENAEIIKKLVEIQQQLRFLHWQTKSYAKHQAYGGIYGTLDDLIDTFVEICMGKHGRPSYSGGYTIEGKDIDEISLQEFIDSSIEFFISLSDVFDAKTDTDLLNIRDEMMGEFNKLKYLLTLK